MISETPKERSIPKISLATKIFLLIIAIIFSANSIFGLYSQLYSQYKRSLLCSQMVQSTIKNPTYYANIDNYISYKIIFENLCMETGMETGINDIFWLIASFIFLGYSISLFRQDKLESLLHKTNINI